MTTRALVGLLVVNLSLAAQDGPLHLVVLEGDGAINNIRSSRAKEPVIRVEDANNQGVAGAVVTFQLPNGGAGGFFGDGGSSLTLTTDDRGEAVARRLHANRIAGTFQIRVSASLGGRMAAASITQTNVDPGSHTSSRKIALLAVLGGVAAGGRCAGIPWKSKVLIAGIARYRRRTRNSGNRRAGVAGRRGIRHEPPCSEHGWTVRFSACGTAGGRDKCLPGEAAPDYTSDPALRNGGRVLFAGHVRHGRERALHLVCVGRGAARGTDDQQWGHYQRNSAE